MAAVNSQIRLEHARQAFQAKDPHLVDLLLQIASATADPNAPPPPEDTYSLAKFSHELSLPSFYKQPAEVQQQVRIEKIGLLELQDADPQLAERLRSHEIILELWQSEGSFERDCLMRILREIPLVYGPWKALKQIFKEAESSNDTEVLAVLSYRFEQGQVNPAVEISRRTLSYLSRRAWRYLRNIGNILPACYADAAVDFLVEYQEHDYFSNTSWMWHHILFHEEKAYTRTQVQGYIRNRTGFVYFRNHTGLQMLKSRAFADLWKRSPLPLFALLERSPHPKIQSYAVAALKQDFRNVIREVETDWVKRLLVSESKEVQDFATWVLENVPKFEQSKFKEMGLHETVLKLFNSRHVDPLNYVTEYARTHARDMPVEDLIRLANHNRNESAAKGKGSLGVRKLAADLLRARDPRKDIGLENWGVLLESPHGTELAQKVLRESFGVKDLTPEWFAERFVSDSSHAIEFVIDRLLDIHPAKTLGPDYFYDLIIRREYRRANRNAINKAIQFATDQYSQFVEDAPVEQLQNLLLLPNHNVRSAVVQWVVSAKIAATKFEPEFLKSIAYQPSWETCPQVVEFKKISYWGDQLAYDPGLASTVFTWLGDIRQFTPDQIGFEWLIELVGRSEPEYHDFAVETMIKAFLPADFADTSEPAEEESSSDEINIDFEEATFVFTGKLATMTRAEAQKKVAAANGKKASTVGKNLGYLVIGDEGSPMYGQGRKGSKQVKAESLNEAGAEIRIISETAFLQMLTGTQREFSGEAVEAGCENLWKMMTESPKENSPLARFALKYLRHHHPEICLEETDRPVDPGSEIPDSFLTFDRVKPLLQSSRASLRDFGLELCNWEFARWAPPLDQLIDLLESPWPQVRDFVANALLAQDTAQNRRTRLDPESFTTDAVYELCQSRDQHVRTLGMELISRHPRLREPIELFKLTESPDRAVRAFVIRAFWSLFRDRETTTDWAPHHPVESEVGKSKRAKEKSASPEERYGTGAPERPGQRPAGVDELQFLLRRMLFEISPGPPPKTKGPSLESLKLKPIPTRKGKMLLVETIRDLAIEDESFAVAVLPILKEFMNSHGMSEHDSCMVAVTRVEAAHRKLKTMEWRDEVEEGATS